MVLEEAWPVPGGEPEGGPGIGTYGALGGVVFHGTVDVAYARFYLQDRAYRPTVSLGGLAGLVTVRPCEVVLVTGTQYGHVGCTVVVSAHDPGARLDWYEDVEEAGFASPTGVMSLVEWGTANPRARDVDLLAGPGSYRLRYHARHMDLVGDADEDGVMDDYLLQIWPALEAPRERLKVTSASGRYWTEIGDVHAEIVTPPVPDGVGREASAAGRARVTEAMAADVVASTYWSHLLLRPGDHVRSRRAWLVFRADGDLVVYDEDARVRWTSGTAGRGVHATFRIDGDLVVHNADGGVEWASGTHGYEGNFLAVQDDGNVVVYRADGNALWATGTNH
ncbi:hypothetical protein [Actinomadura sp. DC4]|uniref:hypothetical protein n=1 Tax=Actinomadura sp. DC4 TaxID=3055069 RepID=UPI0025B0517A|nr:hypothetical protein [Actinomadura sp. DC4]MDN3357661.1 hypothetical protein [Actinomadura sp. DC4]